MSVVGIFFAVTRPSPAQAAANFSLSPATGTYSDDFTVGFYVNVNPTTDEVAGISADIDYTGPITYVSYSDGASNCQVSSLVPSSGRIHVECLATFPDGYVSAPGTIVNLTFNPTGAGTATIQIEIDEVGFVDDKGSVGTATGGTYTLAAGGSTLPDAGLFDSPYLSIVLFIIGSAIAFALSRRPALLTYFAGYGSQSRVIIRKQ